MKGIYLFFLVFYCYDLSGQGINNLYLFGYTGPTRGSVDIFTGAPVVVTDSVRKSNLSLIRQGQRVYKVVIVLQFKIK